MLDADGPRREINVSADAAALQVRKIIRNMVADETGSEFRRPAPRRAGQSALTERRSWSAVGLNPTAVSTGSL